MSVCRYDTPLRPSEQDISTKLGLTTRHFFSIPNPHCNLDGYDDADDF